MKRYIIQQKVNPTDGWRDYKKFDDEKRSKQSVDMLRKHRSNIFKSSEYEQYRVYDIINDIYLNY